MLYKSYEQVIMRDRPAYWWRLGRPETTYSIGIPGSAGEATSRTGTAPYAGAGLPGCSSGISTHTIGTSASAVFNPQGWSSGTHSLPASDTYTVEFWLFPDNLSGTSWHCLMWKNGIGFWSINGNIELSLGGMSNQFIVNGSLLRRQWRHCVGIIRNGANELWVDGFRSRSVSFGSPETSNASGIASQGTTFFGQSAIPDSRFSSWKGWIAEPAYYAYALSPSQIVEHYQAGITPRRATSRLASIMTPPWPTATPAPSGLTSIAQGAVQKRIAVVSDRPR